jgi:sodium/potassium/calcium exchanger 4
MIAHPYCTGFTLGIPDTVMGLTFIAAGVSVPDALSGIAVCKEGHGRP